MHGLFGSPRDLLRSASTKGHSKCLAGRNWLGAPIASNQVRWISLLQITKGRRDLGFAVITRLSERQANS